MRHRFAKVALALVAFGLLGGTATVAARSKHAAANLQRRHRLLAHRAARGLRRRVRRGPASYGLQYATKGTGMVNGKKIELTFADDADRPGQGVSQMKDLIGQGYKIIAGVDRRRASRSRWRRSPRRTRCSSSPARPRRDAITGANKYTFRSGRQTYQDVADAPTSFLDTAAARRSSSSPRTRRSARPTTPRSRRSSAARATRSPSVYVPLTATDFTPFASRSSTRSRTCSSSPGPARPPPAMWKALDQQGVFSSVDDGRDRPRRAGDLRRRYGAAGRRRSRSSRTTSTRRRRTRSNDWLVTQMRKKSQFPDLFTPDGFVAGADDRARARRSGDDDVDKMVSALEGWKFDAPKGSQTIRPQDHAMLQPMFRVTLDGRAATSGRPRCSARADSYQTAPPITTVPSSRAMTKRIVSRTPILRTEGLGLDIGGATIVADVSLEVAPGRVRRRHRPERRRQDVAVQPALRPAARDLRARRRSTGEDITDARRRTGATRLGLGRTFQVSNVFPLLTVRENVRLAARGAPRRDDAALAAGRSACARRSSGRDWALGARRPRGAPRARRPARSSHGDKRKLELAMLLARRPAGDPARRADGRASRSRTSPSSSS